MLENIGAFKTPKTAISRKTFGRDESFEMSADGQRVFGCRRKRV
jgi:hypothetical protein